MLPDPQAIRSDGNFHDFVRVGAKTPERLGRFVSPDGNYEFTIRQDSTANRFRHEIRLTRTKVGSDPVTTANKQVSASVVFVVDEPRWGFSDEDLHALADGILTFAGNSTSFGRLLLGEL